MANTHQIEKKDIIKTLKFCCYLLSLALALGVNYVITNYLKINIVYSTLLKILVYSLIAFFVVRLHKFDFNKIKLKEYDSYSFSKYFIKVTVVLIFLFNIGMCFCFTDGYVINRYYSNEFNASLIEDDDKNKLLADGNNKIVSISLLIV